MLFANVRFRGASVKDESYCIRRALVGTVLYARRGAACVCCVCIALHVYSIVYTHARPKQIHTESCATRGRGFPGLSRDLARPLIFGCCYSLMEPLALKVISALINNRTTNARQIGLLFIITAPIRFNSSS